MEENKIVNVGDVANEQMVENKKNDAKQKYDNAIGASGDSWADELMADDVRRQPLKKAGAPAPASGGSVPKSASGDDWADQMMTDDVRRTQQGNTPPQNVPQNVPQGVPQGQPTPKEIEAAHQSAMEAQYQQVPALKALDEEDDPVQSLRMAQRMMQGDYADLEMANQQGGGAAPASIPRGVNYTQAPRFSDNLDTWKYTKTITTYDEGHPLAQAARHANDYGNQLSAVEKAQVYANRSWDDLNRQSQELMRRHPVKEKNSQQFEHDAQLLAAIHNQMVALEYNFSDQNDMYKNIGQKNLRMYLEPMRNSGNPYVAQYEEMFRQGRNFRDFNPFVYDLPDAVLNQREKDISLGEKKPDNYYLHMALRDKDFSNRYHAWSYFGSIQDNMSWGKYKNLGAQVNDLRDERFKEERAKAFAETPGYTFTAGLLDSFGGKVASTIWNAYDIIAGNPLRTESLNDTLKRSMKYASGGSNAVRGIVSFVPDAVTLMPATAKGAVKTVGALSKLFEFTPKAARYAVAGGSFMGYEVANTIASAWAEGDAPNVAEVIGNGCKGLLLGTAGSAVNAGVTGVLPKAAGRAANYAVRAVGDVAEVGTFVSAEMGMAVASGEHPDFQASLLNNGALIISMKVGHAIAGKGFGIRRDISKSAIEKARALGYDTLADEMVRHNSGRFRNVESAGYSAEALKQLQQIQQNMGKHNVNWREYADMLKPTGASMTRPGVNSVEMVEEDGGYRIVNLDINGVEIDRSKNVMSKDKAQKEVLARQKKIDFKKERANVEAFDNMRDGHIHATAARRVADQINAEMGAQAVNEDGTPNPDYDGITAQDVLSSFSAIGKKHPAERTPEEQRLMDLFLQEFEDIRMASPDSNMIKETICEQYGVSKEDFDAAWSKEPGKRGKGAVAQACAAFNTAMSRSYANVGGDPIIGKVTLSDGRVIEDSVLTRVEVGEDRRPVNPDQKIYYLDEDGSVQVISASEVVAMDLQADLGAQADKIAVENRQRKMEQQQQVVAERLADVQSSVLETHLVELQKQIEGGEDADGRLSVAYNSIAKELDRRYQAEYDGLTQAEKAQRFAESKFPDATPEERADIAQHYTEHPQEFETALHYDPIHNGELKALIDTMELRNPVEWMKKFNEYKGDESAFREAYKKKFGVDPTERPYGFKEEVAKEKAAESAEEDFDAEAEPVEGEDIVEEETVTDGTELPEVEGEEVVEETPPVVQAGTKPEDAVAGVKEEVKKEDTQEPKQEQKKEELGKADPIDELLDRQGITEDVARQKMRETYEQNPDYFEEEYEREFGKKPEVAKKEEVKEEASKSGMPMKEVDGKMKPDFEKATPEQTIDYLLNEKGYSREQVAKMVEKEVSKKVAAVEEKEKAVADAIARQEEADQAQPETELDFDNMDAYDAEVEKINADKAAASEAVEKANKELGDALRERAKWEKTAESLSEREKKEDATPKEEPRKPEEKKEEPKKPEEKKEDSKEEPPAKEQPKEEKETPKEEEKKPEPPKEEKNPEEENKSKFDKTAVKERVAKFKTDTPEEREAFSKSVPKMSDEELLAYMETDGKGEYAKAEHPEVYDEYDKRHKDEYLDEYNKEMQSLLDAETSLVSAKAMRSEIDSSDPSLATASRASFRAKRDALDNYIEDPAQKAWKKANKYKPKQDYDLDEKAPDESRPKDHGIQEEDKEEWQKIAEKVNDEGIVNHINKVAKKLKMPIRMYDGAKGDDGYTQNGVIYVNRNNDNPEKTIAFVIGHEVTHGLQQKAKRIGSDAYNKYREAACDYKRLAIGDEVYEELVNEKMDTYKKRLSRDAFVRARLAGATIEEAQYASDRAAAIVTREYIEDEIASDVTGDFVQNPDKYMDWFREARNMSQARRILEGIRDWFATHFSTVYKKNSKLAEARDKFNALYNEVIETEQLKTFEEKTVTSMTDMASSEKRHSYGTEPDVMKKLRNWLRSSEAKKLGWTPEKADNVLRETETLINTLDKALQGDKNYDEWRLRQPTIRVDWRDGEEHPVVTWSRGNIEYKYDMSADLLCINNEGLEEVLSAPAMVDILINGLKETDITNDYKGNFGRKDYARLYQTLKDLGITVPCPGCFDFATRLDMLPSSAKKFTDAVNKVIDERNKDPEAFDNKLRNRARAKGNALANGLPASAKNTQEAIEVAVAGDNATKHIHWHDMLTADGQTGMLADYGGIFRAWQRLGSAKPKDKLLPEPWIGEMTNTGITTIIAPYGKKTPSFREMEVNQGTGLRRNSHSEFRMTLIIDEIQMLREAFMKNLTVFKYMKELDDVRLFGKLGVKYNMSFFPAFDPKGTAAGLGPNGEYIAAEESVGGREFPYIGEDGKTHYDGMRGRDEAMKHCNENVSLSSVAFSVPHLIKLLTDVPTPKDKSGWVGSIIGFHKTNGTAEQLAAQGLGRVRAIEAGRDKGHLFEDEAMSDWDKGVTNFEQVQNDRFGEDWVAIKNGKEKPVSYGHKMEFVGSKVYYNKRTGYYLFPEGYAHESELPGGKFTESVRNNPPHPFVVDYNDKVRELNSDYGYKDAADFYVQELSKLGMIPRFEFTVPEKVFLDACKAAGVDPRHPKLGWKGEGNDWHVVDSDAYYSLWCDYGMTDPATGKWSPHRPVGFINEKGEREFRLPDNAVEIAQEGMRRYTERREKESAMVNDAIREFAKRSVEQGRMDAKQANKILKAHGINPEGDGGKRMSLSGRKSRAEEIAEEYGDDARGLHETVRNTKVDVNDEDSASYEMSNTRYSLVHDPKELNRLESEIAKGKDVGYVVRYRAVANIEGGHVNPMASKEDGKMRTPFNEGDWEKHEVQDINITPEVQKRIDELDASAKSGYVDIIPGRLRYIKGSKQPGAKGTMKYHLVKDDGSSLWAAYNPWLHSSDTPLNDQFSGAWNRPNLSVIEVYIPISDLNDKTPVKYAKDTVGNTPWKSGPVNGALPKGEQRTVTLSRYAKIGKELSNSEQADLIAPKLLKHNVSVPFNTVTPGLRDELARRGVEITAPEKGSGNACNVAYEEWLNGGEQPRYSLSPEAQRKQQESTNFKNWFGDWENDPENASKVVDKEGRPLVVYHGTPKGGFYIFDTKEGKKGKSKMQLDFGSHFTPNEEQASEYQGKNQRNKNRKVYPVYLDLKNPIDVTQDGEHIILSKPLTDDPSYALSTHPELVDALHNVLTKQELKKYRLSDSYNEVYNLWNMLNDMSPKRAREVIEALGFDGVKYDARYQMGGLVAPGYKNERRDVSYIALRPNQIKSATENNGDFSRSNPDIRYSLDASIRPTFYSNAARAVENIKQNKATAEQWLAMIKKNGGLKAGEDKWMGLSQWLEDNKGKSLTKEEVQQFIADNGIEVEEVNYAGVGEDWITLRDVERAGQTAQGRTSISFERAKSLINMLVGDFYEFHIKDIDNQIQKLEGLRSQEKEDLEGEIDPEYLERGQRRIEEINGDIEFYSEVKKELEKQFPPVENPVNSTRLDYTTKGLDNKREIAFKVPNIEPYQEHDEVHFGPENQGKAVMWVRFGETTDAGGNRVLVIDEIQSNRHQDAREKGYRKSIEDYKNSGYRVERNSSNNGNLIYDKDGNFIELVYDNERPQGVPAAPFEKNWHEVAMKRMLRLAAEEGFDKVAWTTGEQQAKRYNIGRMYDSIEREDNPSIDGKRFVLSGRNMDTFVVNKEGNIEDSSFSEFNGKPLSDVVGKDLAERMMNLEDGDMLEGEDLRIGGEGMKGFYDQMLPRFMDKYGKRWGVKTGTVELPNVEEAGRTMHSVDVTPQMKESVMQGQPRFSLTQGEYADKLSELLARRRNGENVTDELRQLNEDWRNEARQAAEQFSGTEATEQQNRAVRRAEQEAQRQENKNAKEENRVPVQFPRADLPTTGYENPQTAVGMAQAAQVRAVLRGEGSRETRRTAVRQLTATMRDLHKAMRAQRDYDRATVGEVVDLVKTYGDLGLLDDATAGEVKKLLTAIKDSTGAEDLHDATTRVLDVVLGAQSRNIKETIKALLSTQAAKIGAKGVVEGKMDILGQTAMKELNDWMGRSLVGCNSRLNELSALRAAAEAKVASASGEAEKARAENELAKVKIRQTAAEMAKNYADRLEATEENIRQIENELEQLKQDYKDKIVKGKEYREQKHLLENLLRENRIDQLQTLWDSVNDVHTAVAEGLERGKMFAERQQEHADEIRHDANKDLEGVSTRTQDHPGALAKVANNVVVKGASASLYTLDTMLRTLGHKAINGEGFLYERFGRGWLECRDNEITGFWANRDAIDAKAEELFGPKIVAGVKVKRKFSDLIAKARGMKKINVRYFDGGEMRDHEFDQAQALYVYMVNKMDDGAIKLRRMGITEEDVNAIKAQLDNRFVKLADWLQGDFLKRKHAEYNEVHERMFGAPMANIENYVPLRIDQRKRSQEVDISKQLGEEKLSSTTGGIIERVHNTSPLDLLNTNAIDLVLDHLQEMNHWQHFAEWNRDVNTLLSDTTFRNKVMNSKTIYGSGKQLWDRLNQVFQLAGGVYRPKGGDFDTAVVRIAQGVSAAKVSFRVFTAAKQLLSLPVFATECDPHLLLKNVGELFSPVKSGKGENSFKWCMENLPSFKERWKGRMAGDTRLESTELDWNFTKKNIVQWASKFGLTPNAFIDACTVAAGAKSVYETKRGRYLRQGYSEEQADKLAKQDATVAFNQSQQSSEKMFVAPMQVDRTGLAVGASLFRNASMGYERKMVSGVKDTSKFLKGSFSGWKKERAFLERMYQERGLTDTQAKRAAWSTVIRHGIKSMLNIAMYSVGAQAAWNIGGKLPYMIFGDNGDEKRKILKEELIHAALGGWLEGLPFGDNVSNGINNYYCGNKWNTFDPALLPLQADIMKIIQKFDKDFAGGEKTVSETWSAITDVIGLGIQSGIGVNPETFTSILASIVDWGWGRNQTKVDFGPAKEALFFALRFVNTPNTQLDQMYIDEIGMTGAEARKFTPEEIAKRYAFYKTHGSTITAWHLYSREQQDKIVAKYEDAFMKKIGAKDETVDDYIAHAESLNSQNARNTQYNKAYKEVQKNGTAADAWKYYQQELEKFKATGIKQHATCATKWHDIYQEMAGLVPPGKEKEEEDQNVMVSVKDLKKEQKVALLFNAEENSKYLGFTKTIARYTGSSDGGESKLVNELRKLGGSISKKQGGWYFTGENANKAEKMYQQHKEEADRCALATFDKKRVDELINAMNDRRNDYMSDDAMRQIIELCDYWENKMLEDQKKKEKK